MLSFDTLQKVVYKDNNHILITAGKTASQVFKAWDLQTDRLFTNITAISRQEIVNRFKQGCNIDFIIRHPAERYISGIKEIILEHSLIETQQLLKRSPKTNINDTVKFDTMLAYWHTTSAWHYALNEVFGFWSKNSKDEIDFSFRNDYHVCNWLENIEYFINIAEDKGLNNLRIIEVNDISYYGPKEFDVVFPVHHKSPISYHVTEFIRSLLPQFNGFIPFILPEQQLYHKLIDSKYFYKVENNHPRNQYYNEEY